MKLCVWLFGIVAFTSAAVTATTAVSPGGTTPLKAPLAEETETLIACELAAVPGPAEAWMFEDLKDAQSARGIWHYKLWLPKGYSSAPRKPWPCMFIMSPFGHASMGTMADILKAKGYVVVMLVEAKNGRAGPIVGNFMAAYDDVIKRLRIKADGKFATGLSGGARASSLFVQARPGFGGIILQSAGAALAKDGNYNAAALRNNGNLHVAMTMGTRDTDLSEVDRMKSYLANPGRFRSFVFSGGHEWAPADTFAQALGWVEQKNGL